MVHVLYVAFCISMERSCVCEGRWHYHSRHAERQTRAEGLKYTECKLTQ